jgi:hypothetical protein
MTKLSSAFKINDSIRIKTFELGGHSFKVKVPLNKELEDIGNRIVNIPKEEIDSRLKKMTSALTTEKVEGVEVTENDVIVDGKSTKETIVAVAQMERRVVEYIKLLVPDSGSLDDLTYQDVEEEFPFSVQIELVEKISESIQPGYKDARKN